MIASALGSNSDTTVGFDMLSTTMTGFPFIFSRASRTACRSVTFEGVTVLPRYERFVNVSSGSPPAMLVARACVAVYVPY